MSESFESTCIVICNTLDASGMRIGHTNDSRSIRCHRDESLSLQLASKSSDVEEEEFSGPRRRGVEVQYLPSTCQCNEEIRQYPCLDLLRNFDAGGSENARECDVLDLLREEWWTLKLL